MTIQLQLSHTFVERENELSSAAWQLQATKRNQLLGQRNMVTLLSGNHNVDTLLLNLRTVSFTYTNWHEVSVKSTNKNNVSIGTFD